MKPPVASAAHVEPRARAPSHSLAVQHWQSGQL